MCACWTQCRAEQKQACRILVASWNWKRKGPVRYLRPSMKTSDNSCLRIALVPPLWARLAPGTSGGTEEVVRTLADGLVKRGHDVTVFAARDSVTCAKVTALSDRNL